jgi:hypothetical protein
VTVNLAQVVDIVPRHQLDGSAYRFLAGRSSIGFLILPVESIFPAADADLFVVMTRKFLFEYVLAGPGIG